MLILLVVMKVIFNSVPFYNNTNNGIGLLIKLLGLLQLERKYLIVSLEG